MAYRGYEHDSLGPLTRLYNEEGAYTYDFTLLFEDAVLTAGPLILGSLLIVLELSWKTSKGLKRTTGLLTASLGWIKLILYTIFISLSCTFAAKLAIHSTQDNIPHSSWTIAVVALSIIAALLITCDNLIHHAWFLKPSSPAQLLLAWWSLSDGVSVRSRWLLGGDNKLLAVFQIALLVTKLAIIISEEWSKRRILVPSHAHASPESLAGIHNRMLLAWLNPLMWRSLSRTIEAQELWPVEAQFGSKAVKRDGRGPHKLERSLFTSLLKEHWWYWLAPLPTRLAQAGFTFAQPFLIYQTLLWLYLPNEDSETIGYGLLAAYSCIYIGIAITTAFGQYQVVRLLARIRVSLIARIYRKSMEMRATQYRDMAALTLMSTNVDKVVDGFMVLQEVVVSTVLLAFGLWLLQRQIGLGFIGPVIVVGLLAVTLGCCAPGMARAQKIWIDAIKCRVQFASHVLGNLQTAKMSGLMTYLADRLQGLRMTELKKSLPLRRFMVMTVSTSLGAPNLAPLLAFTVYALVLCQNGSTLDPVLAFTALSYITLINFPLLVVMQTTPHVIQAFACLSQIDQFLRKEDLHARVSSERTRQRNDAEKPADAVIMMEDCSFSRSSAAAPVLDKINLTVARGSFTQIIGPSASGKSTLVQALLGELYCTEGSFTTVADHKSIAYAPQHPWIRKASVEENITMGSSMNKEWYDEVVFACALDQDLEPLRARQEGGGVTLSGGQRQKVSLARAFYSKQEIVVIDEPFTGIDATSCKQIVARLFGQDGLFRRHRLTVIMTSHSDRYIWLADYIIELNSDCSIAQQGTPQTLNIDHSRHIVDTNARRTSSDGITAAVPNPVASLLNAREQNPTAKSRDRRAGDMAAYGYYFSSLGWIKLMLTGLFVALFVFFQLFTQPWVTWWTESNLADPNNRMGYWLGMFASYGVLAILSLAAACKYMLVDMVRASGGSLHATLCKTIERATITAAAVKDPGITLNRFSQDMTLVDMELPLALSSLAIMFMLTLGQFGLILSASRYLAAVIPLIVLACIVIQRLYIKTSRQLRFHEIESKAPLFSHFIETLDGLVSIRAYNLQEKMQDEMDEYIDTSQKPFYLLLCAQRYLGLLLNLTVAGLVIILIGIAIVARGKTDTSFYGQALVNVMTFGQSLAMVIDYWTQFEIGLAAVERTKEFAEDTPHETTAEPAEDATEHFRRGRVCVTDLSAEFSPGVPVLDRVSLSIRPGEKVAICGRSGSGKSTLCLAMVRLLEPTQGCIAIDDRNIAGIPHDHLRSAIGTVPQDPLLFEDTLRINLDPLDESNDSAMKDVMRTVCLWDKFEAAKGLDTEVSATALSVSERQMICLGRALLKERKVLILDEATSSVDAITDEKVQHIVCKTLQQTTVVSVMHRFDHIRLYDRIVMMSEGRVIESGRPEELLARSSSDFARLYASERSGN